MCASTLCPFWSSTRKLALRRHSTTVPSSWMPPDSLVMFRPVPVDDSEVGEVGSTASAEHQLQVAADSSGTDAFEQGVCRVVGLVHVRGCRRDAAPVGRTEYLGQQRPGDTS